MIIENDYHMLNQNLYANKIYFENVVTLWQNAVLAEASFPPGEALTAIHQIMLLFTSVSSLELPTSPTAQWSDSC